MTPIQVAALEKFLARQGFDYYDYDNISGLVIYVFIFGDWKLRVAFGDECYYCIDNELTKESTCKEFTKVCEVMTEYDKLCYLTAPAE